MLNVDYELISYLLPVCSLLFVYARVSVCVKGGKGKEICVYALALSSFPFLIIVERVRRKKKEIKKEKEKKIQKFIPRSTFLFSLQCSKSSCLDSLEFRVETETEQERRERQTGTETWDQSTQCLTLRSLLSLLLFPCCVYSAFTLVYRREWSSQLSPVVP